MMIAIAGKLIKVAITAMQCRGLPLLLSVLAVAVRMAAYVGLDRLLAIMTGVLATI